LTELTGSPGRATSTFGAMPATTTGAKSKSVS
jgi:hypothetical protein